jgi:GWxTD domain-containing protein
MGAIPRQQAPPPPPAPPAPGQSPPAAPLPPPPPPPPPPAQAATQYLAAWPEQEVPDIIAGEEREEFKALRRDEEREQFIESFWTRRDPTPGTATNEYRDEYYRRVAVANEKYTRDVPGWRTDRGRIYILHGEPDEVTTLAAGGTYRRAPGEGGGRTTTFPLERWRYRHIEGLGNNIILEFVDTNSDGNYRLEFDPAAADALLRPSAR